MGSAGLRLLRSTALAGLFLLVFAAAPGAAQIGINGTRQAASARGDVEIMLSPFSRCGSRHEVAIAAGSAARGVERERIMMDYRRYASGGLTEAEEAMLADRARRLEVEAGRAYRYASYENYEHRRRNDNGPRYQRSC